ncbi:MAG TPA: dTDP-4-dehydrorhamnose reductase [Longimicrobiales bacterium]
MRVLVTGAGGLLGRALQTTLPDLGLPVIALTHDQLDVTDTEQTAAAIGHHQPGVVINCAAYTRVDDAEANEQAAYRVNALAVEALAAICARHRIRLVYPSTDYVFDGNSAQPYKPADVPHPINAYGRSKLAGEEKARAAGDHLIIRTSWLFGGGGSNFVRTIANRLHAGEALRIVNDQTGRPTCAHDLAQGIGKLLVSEVPSGTYHMANTDTATWFTFAREIAARVGKSELITPCTTADYPRPARRPASSVLDTSAADALIGPLRSWREALADAISRGDY